MGGTDRSLALLGLGHLVGVAVVGSDQNGVAVLVSRAGSKLYYEAKLCIRFSDL